VVEQGWTVKSLVPLLRLVVSARNGPAAPPRGVVGGSLANGCNNLPVLVQPVGSGGTGASRLVPVPVPVCKRASSAAGRRRVTFGTHAGIVTGMWDTRKAPIRGSSAAQPLLAIAVQRYRYWRWETSLFIQPHIGKWWKVPNLTYTRMTYAGVVLSPLLRLPDPGWRVSVK